jgi:hypothetical protein
MRLVGAAVVWLALTPPVATAAQPVLGKTVAVEWVSGTVLVRAPRAGAAVPLAGRTVIPVGSTVDVTHGKVRLTTAKEAHGSTQFGLFDGGAFVVTQQRSALTDLTLAAGVRRTVCTLGASAARVGARVLRTLHGRAHGQFRTVGGNASATVRGTDWTMSDRCDGTVVADHRGKVETKPSAVSTSATDSQVVLPPLASGDSAEYRCAPGGAAPVSRKYCVAVLAFDHTILDQGRLVRVLTYSAQLLTDGPYYPLDVCTTAPNGVASCTHYPLDPPDSTGARLGNATCTPNAGPGAYQISWRLGGVVLGAPLVYQAPAAGVASGGGCFSSIGKESIGALAAPIDLGIKSVNGYQLPTAAVAYRIRIFLAPVTDNHGTQVMRGILYQDSGSGPSALLGTTNELAFSSTEAPGWDDLSFPRPIQLAAGVYDIGVLAGGKSAVAAFAYDRAAGTRAANLNPYASGPSDPFGPFGVDSLRWSLYLFYKVASP